jgi:L-fuconolactonase
MNAEETNPAWAYLNRTRYPVCVQMRPPGIAMLRDVLDRFPDLRIVVDNAARVEMTDAGMRPLFDLAEAGEVYVKVTTNTLRRAGEDAPGFMRALIDAFGSDRVAWGSDFPAMVGSMTEFVALARDSVAGLPDSDQANFFDNTARALYPEGS